MGLLNGAPWCHIHKGSPATIRYQTDNVEAVVAQAVAAGAKVTMPVADLFWGDRYGVLEDPFGHQWSVATHQRDVSQQEFQDAVEKMVVTAPG